MMKEVTVKIIWRDSRSVQGEKVKVKGWVRTIRNSKNFSFMELNDGSFFKNLQVIFDPSLPGYEEIAKLGVGAAVEAEGILVESPAPKQPVELHAQKVIVTGASPEEYPLQKKRHTFEYLRTIAHLRPRTNTFSAVFRLRHLLAYAVHRFFHEQGFIYVHTPLITGSDCEGAGEMFRVTTLDMSDVPKNEEGKIDFSKDFFGKETNLTVSGQLNVESYCQAFGKVYTFGPAFRAENSNTPRHLSELWMIEPEIAFADLNDDMELAEAMVKDVFSFVLREAPEEMEFFNSFIQKGVLEKMEKIVASDFGRMTYTEAIQALKTAKKEFQFPVEWGCDLQTEHERFLSEEVFGRPVFVTDYPKEIKAFYMRLNDDEKTVAAMDLLVPGVGELIGGSQREERYDVLLKRIHAMGLKESDYWWYLDLRKYGSTPHAGFGIGFERALMALTGMENIRDVIPFPRVPKNAEF